MVACAFLPVGAVAAGGRPNFVFILADDLGYMDIGANNPNTFYETPNIDRLAEEGMRFTQGYAAGPVCSPTRASLMTGKYPPRTGITDFIGGTRIGRLKPAPNRDRLALEEVTIAERLRDGGYVTFFAGKWHLGAGDHGPKAQGFDGTAEGGGQFYYPASDSPADVKDDPKNSDYIAGHAERFIAANKDKPFFAYLPFLAPHVPIKARPDLIAKYEKKRANAKPETWGQERQHRVRLVQNHALYAAMLEQLDAAVGRVVAALEKHSVLGETVIVFTSDNGGLSTAEGHPTSNLPMRAGKGWLYEGGLRTPWIVRAPGISKAGSVCETPVITNDIFPTIVELAGLAASPTANPKGGPNAASPQDSGGSSAAPGPQPAQADGISLVPLLKGGEARRGAPLFWHYPHYSNQGGPPGGAIRGGEWKLIEWYEDGVLELFNLREDPGEKNNLASLNPDKVKELSARLQAYRKDVNALMPTENLDYQRDDSARPKK
ncbi:MAG: sulfatase [Verrucomicrobiales bacterium]